MSKLRAPHSSRLRSKRRTMPPALGRNVSAAIATLVLVSPAAAVTTTPLNIDESGSIGSSGGDANTISADGRYTVFETIDALVATDTNANFDLYVHDRLSGELEHIVPIVNGAFFDAFYFRPFHQRGRTLSGCRGG